MGDPLIKKYKDRKEYWNEQYMQYWKARTSAEGKRMAKKDCVPADVSVFDSYLKRLGLKTGETVLEVGAGFGRLIPSILKYGVKLSCIDISPQMIRNIIAEWGDKLEDVNAVEAENLPYEHESFDYVICWAVFDACYQSQALHSMARVLKTGGKLMLTGKNDNYCDDDEPAFVAEVNARAKGHPNYFTNLIKLNSEISQAGLKVKNIFYFERRGDLSENKYFIEKPECFYEYVLISEKTANVSADFRNEVSQEFSKTFLRKKNNENP